MWVVTTVVSEREGGKDHQRSLYRSLYAVGGREPVGVVLRNTETYERVYLSSRTTQMFDKVIAGYKPYGWITSETAGIFNFPSEGDELFVEIDDLSLQFLDYIDSVEYMSDDADADVCDLINRIPTVFIPWDSFSTILEWTYSYGTMACTLFQVICYLPSGWHKDEYLIRVGVRGFRVSFKDIARARALVAKAVSLGYNPLKNDEKELRFI